MKGKEREWSGESEESGMNEVNGVNTVERSGWNGMNEMLNER